MKTSSRPPKLADTTRSTSVSTACSQGSTGNPVSASNSAVPAANADEPVQVTSSWTRRSSSNRGSTSSSRVAAVTLCTTTSTRRHVPRVAHRAASSPTGTRTHPARPNPIRTPLIGPGPPRAPVPPVRAAPTVNQHVAVPDTEGRQTAMATAALRNASSHGSCAAPRLRSPKTTTRSNTNRPTPARADADR
ncbi:hypothetical protein [Streptomyces sp. NPDC048295]|uniref:hypothetical protein n=1 Tax=Streptomyces sp. NPDC048295 TaxID=3154617 RepID=UPI00341E276A